ncbi:hypothetical protein PVK06_043365 [Gossypium arboreum]|uniref:Uncharacterized protein n=1 Tax=Gossypium arboreum TaxID=29729 RepID=A0ABR0MNP8_GOSAR|nr:hypothetical protein PVK06_043365 [Gossypium arboreum]
MNLSIVTPATNVASHCLDSTNESGIGVYLSLWQAPLILKGILRGGIIQTAESNDYEHNIPKAFRGTESQEITQAKGFLDEIQKRFAENDKVEMTSLLTYFMLVKYKSHGNVREYIMEMFYVASRLKELNI